MSSGLQRGMALGLWILAGGAFLLAALLPGSAGGVWLGPALVSAAVLWTAAQRESGRVEERGRPASLRRVPLTLSRSHALPGEALAKSGLPLASAVIALAIALTIIREGDVRSWWAVGFAAITALVVGWGTIRYGK